MATGARVYDVGIGTVGNNTWATMAFSQERYDYGGLHSTVTNTSILQAPTKGVYIITGHFGFETNTTGQRGLRIIKNGSTVIATDLDEAIDNFAHLQSIATLWELDGGDYVELQVYQNSGAARTPISATAYSVEFAAHLVEAT